MPIPPAARLPPPSHARVAFVAAAPAKPEIAAPVDAVPSAITPLYAPKAVNAPATVPAAVPPANDPARLLISRSPLKSCASILTNSSRPGVFRKSTFFSRVKRSRNCFIPLSRTNTFFAPSAFSDSPLASLHELIRALASSTILFASLLISLALSLSTAASIVLTTPAPPSAIAAHANNGNGMIIPPSILTRLSH